MNCPHCQKVIIVKLSKDSSVGQAKQDGDSDTADLGELLGMIDDASLSGQSLDFVTQTRERFAKYKDRTRMSDKQMAWLRKIAAGEGEEW